MLIKLLFHVSLIKLLSLLVKLFIDDIVEREDLLILLSNFLLRLLLKLIQLLCQNGTFPLDFIFKSSLLVLELLLSLAYLAQLDSLLL